MTYNGRTRKQITNLSLSPASSLLLTNTSRSITIGKLIEFSPFCFSISTHITFSELISLHIVDSRSIMPLISFPSPVSTMFWDKKTSSSKYHTFLSLLWLMSISRKIYTENQSGFQKFWARKVASNEYQQWWMEGWVVSGGHFIDKILYKPVVLT